MVAVEVATAAADVVTNGEHTKCANEVFPLGNTSFMYNVHSPKLKHIVRAS